MPPAIEYLRRYRARMASAPRDIHRFADPKLSEARRAELTAWLRDVGDRESTQALQIRFSFSVPSEAALRAILRLPVSGFISLGAGLGYWEHLLQQRGAAVLAVDGGGWYPAGMEHMPVVRGGPEVLAGEVPAVLAAAPGVAGWQDVALLLAWPDSEEASTLGADCLQQFQGRYVAHVGELLGATASSNPWGQSTAARCQRRLFSCFRRVAAVGLPRWPGHWDEVTLWQRVAAEAGQQPGAAEVAAASGTDCAGGEFVHVLPLDRLAGGGEEDS